MMTTTTPACWADPLTRDERRKVAEFLARACSRFYNTPAGTPGAMLSQIIASAEMSDLHLDVTERAELPADHPVTVQSRQRFAELTEMSGNPEWMGI